MSDITGNSQALGEAHIGEFLAAGLDPACYLLFWPVFPSPWPVCAPDQAGRLRGRLMRNRVQLSHLLLGVLCSCPPLPPYPVALTQLCAPGATCFQLCLFSKPLTSLFLPRECDP